MSFVCCPRWSTAMPSSSSLGRLPGRNLFAFLLRKPTHIHPQAASIWPDDANHCVSGPNDARFANCRNRFVLIVLGFLACQSPVFLSVSNSFSIPSQSRRYFNDDWIAATPWTCPEFMKIHVIYVNSNPIKMLFDTFFRLKCPMRFSNKLQ